MTFQKHRRHRGSRKPAFRGDFRSDEAVTEVLSRVQFAGYDGRTWHLGGPPHPDPALQAAPTVLTGKQAPWVMEINAGAPAIPADSRLRRARGFLELKAAYLIAKGMGYRIDDAERVLERGEELPPGSVVADAHAEAVTHLLGDHGEWTPAGGWNHGWAEGLPWYDPDVREPWWDAPATRGTS